MLLFFFKQKTAYEMRISDWSSDVCSSDLPLNFLPYAALYRKIAPDHGRARPSRGKAFFQSGAKGNFCGAGLVDPLPRPEKSRWWIAAFRSEERSVGKECVSTCRSRWSPYHEKKKKT